MAELIAIGSTQVDSGDFAVTAGSPKTLYIKNTPGAPFHDVVFVLQHRTPAATYTDVTTLDAGTITQRGNILGIGTFRVRRLASPSGNQAGMDIEG